MATQDFHLEAGHALVWGRHLSAEDVAVMNGCLERNEVHGDHHFIFGFEGGMTIKIGASSGHVATVAVEMDKA